MNSIRLRKVAWTALLFLVFIATMAGLVIFLIAPAILAVELFPQANPTKPALLLYGISALLALGLAKVSNWAREDIYKRMAYSERGEENEHI